MRCTSIRRWFRKRPTDSDNGRDEMLAGLEARIQALRTSYSEARRVHLSLLYVCARLEGALRECRADHARLALAQSTHPARGLRTAERPSGEVARITERIEESREDMRGLEKELDYARRMTVRARARLSELHREMVEIERERLLLRTLLAPLPAFSTPEAPRSPHAAGLENGHPFACTRDRLALALAELEIDDHLAPLSQRTLAISMESSARNSALR